MRTNNTLKVAVMTMALVAVALAPSFASAQSTVSGKVTLPCTTYWGSKALPAGEYQFSMTTTGGGTYIVAIRGVEQFIGTKERDSDLKGDTLMIERYNGIAVVKALSLASHDVKLSFQTSRRAKEFVASADVKPEILSARVTIAAE